MLLAYADDIDNIGLNRSAVTAALEKDSRRLGLTSETKYMVSITKEPARMEPSVSVDKLHL